MALSKGSYVSGGFDLLKAPNAPTVTSVTTGIGTMSVAFTAPADTGAGPVTGYTVTAINESTGASVGATGSASPISVTTGGGTFKVRAAATNIYGPGRVSGFDTGKVVFSGQQLWAWGSNSNGQLGTGDRVNRSSPVQVGALTTWSTVATGYINSHGVLSDGRLFSWGSNDNWGQLGLNLAPLIASSRSSPVQVGALTNWMSVSVGCASAGAQLPNCLSLKTDGTLWSWGRNTFGQLGDLTVSPRSSPVQVGTATNWASFATGGESSFAITSAGTLWSWGSNTQGQLGLNITTSYHRSSPIQVGALTTWAKVAAGNRLVLSTRTDGTLWAWGYNNDGQLGLGDRASKSSPVQVGALTNWASVGACFDSSTSVAVKTDGTLWGWGRNTQGQVGDGTTIARSSPVQIGALTNWSRVSCGGQHTGAVKTDGTLWMWGRNASGALGLNITYSSYRSSPVQVGALSQWFGVSTGSFTSLALYGVT